VTLPLHSLDASRVAAILGRYSGGAEVSVAEHVQSGRNRLFLAESSGGQSWIAKQNQADFDSEAWFYEHAAETFGAAPRCLLADTMARTVILEQVPVARTLHEISVSDPLGVLGMASVLAPILAQLHGTKFLSPPPAQCVLPELDPVDMYSLATASPAAVDLLQRVQARPQLAGVLQKAREQLGPKGLIHGDLKIDNILWSPTGYHFIDWELCGLGPLGWDFGALLGSLVCLWIDGLAIDESGEIEQWVAGGEIPFEILHKAVGTFIENYNEGADIGVPDRESLAVHVAAWIVGRVWAEAALGRRLSARQLVRLVVAESLAAEPYELFGDLIW
jgi:hypothetical protein